MVKTPRTRHSTSKREPVTIDLEAVKGEAPQESPVETETPLEAAEAVPPEAEVSQTPTDPEDVLLADVKAEAEASASGSDVPPSDSTEETVVSPPPAAARSGRGGAIAGGVIGGLVALLLAGGLQYSGVLPPLNNAPQSDSGVQALRDEISSLQSQVAELKNQPTAPAANLDEALAEPRQQIAQLRETVQSLEQQVASGGSGDQTEALAQLEQRRVELEKSFQELSQRLSQSGSADGELAQRLESAERELTSLRETVQSAGNESREAATAATNEAVASVTSRIDQIAGQVDALTQRLEEIATEVARQDEGPKVALVVAASALKSAVDRGASFASELETYSSLASNAAELDSLRPYAENGIPTLAALSEEASSFASRIAAAENAVPESAGLMERFTSSIKSVVTVRPVGEVQGEQPSAIAARVEAAVQRGDLAAALRELDTLPENLKNLGSDFAAKLRARQAANEVLDKALSSALKPA